MTFYQWIIKFKDVDLPIGDLASDIAKDAKFPKNLTTFEELESYINVQSGPVYEAAKNAFAYFKLDQAR